MNCTDARDLLPQHTAGELEDHPDLEAHLRECSSCARHAELSGMVWDLAGLAPEEPLPDEAIQGVYDSIERVRRRPRRMLNSLLRLGTVAAAAVLLAAGAWWIAGPEAPSPRPHMYGFHVDPESTAPGRALNTVKLPPDLSFQNLPWEEFLASLRRVSDVEIVVDSEIADSFPPGTSVTAAFREETLGEVLHRVISPLGLEYEVLEEGVVLISTVERFSRILTLRVYRVESGNGEALAEELRTTMPPGAFDEAAGRSLEAIHGVLVARTDLLTHRGIRDRLRK